MQEERHKKCFKCGESKPLSYFYKHSQMADGHVNKCKECNKQDVRDNYSSNNEYYRQYDRERLKDKTSPRNVKKVEYSREYGKNNPQKAKTRYSLGNAIRDKRVIRGCNCEHCGSTDNIHGHHSSYVKDMWFMVTWLCGKCHVRLHKRLRI